MDQSKDIIFIFNPNSGRRKTVDLIKDLLEINPNARYFISHSRQAFDQFFDTEVHQYKVVVICGGDGTINSALKYLVGKDIALAVIPNGSGNGFARELGFKNDIKKLLHQIHRGDTLAVDLIKVNDDLSCNVTGLGIDSYITTAFDGRKGRGLKGYIYTSFLAYLKFKPIHAKVMFDNASIDGKYLMVCIANTRQFGSGAFIAPEAKYHDGLLEVVLIRPAPFYVVLALIFKLFWGKLSSSKYISFFQTASLIIESDSTSYHVDGEPKKMTSSLHISIIGQISVIKMS